MKASAPKSLAAGFQLFVKIFVPSLLNHEVDCWMVATAIRTRITSTTSLRGYFAELRHGHAVDVGGQRRVAQAGERLLAGAEQVAKVRLEQRRVIRARLGRVDQIPRLVGDRVRARAGCVDRVEGQV